MKLARCEIQQDVGVIVLDDPGSLNALSAQLIEDLAGAFEEATANPAVRAIVLTGAGKGFCAGGKLTDGDLAESVVALMKSRLNPLLLAISESAKPVVTAVNGAAAGAGVGLALAGDVTIAATSARFILSFIRVGLVLDAGTSKFVVERIGAARTRALALLGEPLEAGTAAEWGLIWKAVAPEELMAEALSVARRLGRAPAGAMSAIRRQLAQAGVPQLNTALDVEADLQRAAIQSEEFAEGVRAFKERREPQFRRG